MSRQASGAIVMAVLALVVILALTACGAPNKGDVISKKYTPEREWTTTEPDYDTKSYSCTKYRTKTKTVNGKTTSESVPYSATCTKRVQDGSDEVDHYSPEKYRLQIQDGDNTGWVTVDEDTYEQADVGDYYDEGSIK